MKHIHGFLILLILVSFPAMALAQLSPGELTEVHAFLEGLSNCTKCHTAGSKVSNDKCLDCHKELKVRIDAKKGYHASARVYKKSCVICHSDHHGRKYQIIHFDKSKFNHTETGYVLQGSHKKAECADCHKPANITDPVIRKKKQTYLGLETKCLSCHEDYHQATLSNDCKSCHGFDKFIPAPGFEHSKTRFPLKGKHLLVDCAKCHPSKQINKKEIRQFTGIAFQTCKSCHADPHNNKFGSDCSKCHTEVSFKSVKALTDFDHNQTGFPLKGKHVNTNCKSCHKSGITATLKHNRCADCHSDYHQGDFVKPKQTSPDCKECHTENGFQSSTYTLERHNLLAFKLEDAHEATPCFACHKKQDRWEFKIPEQRCANCHPDIHKDELDLKYYPDQTCESCHTVSTWSEVQFNHSSTGFELVGKHLVVQCYKCHVKSSDGFTKVVFRNIKNNCSDCHTDVHLGQFINDEKNDCFRCHTPESWKAALFDHNKARFQLDGKHKELNCTACHPREVKNDNWFVLYKTGRLRCEDCH